MSTRQKQIEFETKQKGQQARDFVKIVRLGNPKSPEEHIEARHRRLTAVKPKIPSKELEMANMIENVAKLCTI